MAKKRPDPMQKCAQCRHPRFQHRTDDNELGGPCRSKFRLSRAATKPERRRFVGKGGYCKCATFHAPKVRA